MLIDDNYYGSTIPDGDDAVTSGDDIALMIQHDENSVFLARS